MGFNEQHILDQLDAYFSSTPKSEIERRASAISLMGFEGVTFEEYISGLNSLNNFEEFNCIFEENDFSESYNKGLSKVIMGDDGISFTQPITQQSEYSFTIELGPYTTPPTYSSAA